MSQSDPTSSGPVKDRMVLAVPSKGRLKEQTENYFTAAGFDLSANGNDRAYTGTLSGIDGVDVLFLPAQEIADRLDAGSIDLGITGLDLLDEQDSLRRRQVYVLLGTGFGQADVIVAVPNAWIDVASMDDLDDVATLFRRAHGHRMRVATKYTSLTRRFFTAHGVGDYRIVESPGATEAAPSVGAAELIVDISSTGSTIKANKLKILDDGVMLRSEAVLAASLTADWSPSRLDRFERIAGQFSQAFDTQSSFPDFQVALTNAAR